MSFLSRILVQHLRSPSSALTGCLGRNSWKVVSGSRSVVFSLFKRREAIKFCSNSSSSVSSGNLTSVAKDDLEQVDSIQPIEAIEDESLLPSQRQKQHSDLLMVKIYACDSADEVLSLFSQHQEVMGTHHLLAIMNRLRVLVENG
ncbi:uncharacterized protein LOC122243776 [Penaeus japonicus]|uniref:uncharacterized protein LOC122243776 n=1 Tax=Penaeus japonicus TaxID=27405 RepID=UPI001C7132FD|nr:uncharacterized protein LOC122243776 [Penaeus japonicus]XP_042857405.1 uncharacterized protein LOC122243776 [Penaeus japonicus]